MDKIVAIRDWSGHKKEVTIKALEDVQKIQCDIISGDEVLTVNYRNGNQVKFDASEDRWMDFYDMTYEIPIEKLDLFSDQINSYEAAYVIIGESEHELETKTES